MNFLLQGFIKAISLIVSLDQETLSALTATLQVTGISMSFSLAAGIPAGFFLGYFNFKGKKSIRLIVDTLLSLPTVFIGLVVYAFLSSRGPMGNMGLLFSIPGIAIGQIILALPIVISLSATAVDSADANLKETLISLGADKIQLILTTLWEVRYAITSAALTAYGRVMTEVGISMMVGGNIKWHTRTITTAIALETGKGLFAQGIALGIILMIIALAVNFSVTFLKKH